MLRQYQLQDINVRDVNIYVQTYIMPKDTQLIHGHARIQSKAIRQKNPHSKQLLIRTISHMHLPIQYSEEEKK